MEERPKSTEKKQDIITADKIRTGVLKYFKGVDINTPGTIINGDTTIRTSCSGDKKVPPNEIVNVVIRDGKPIATFDRINEDNGKSRTVYSLREQGQDHQYTKLLLAEIEQAGWNRSQVIAIDYGGRENKPISYFKEDDLREIAKIFNL